MVPIPYPITATTQVNTTQINTTAATRQTENTGFSSKIVQSGGVVISGAATVGASAASTLGLEPL